MFDFQLQDLTVGSTYILDFSLIEYISGKPGVEWVKMEGNAFTMSNIYYSDDK